MMPEIDPNILEKYYSDATFPITQEELMLLVRSHNASDEIVEQMEQMLRSDIFYNLDQIANELSGFYNDGEAEAMDGEDFTNTQS